ncbi:MAG: LysE family translocator [Alphaproteobacteria bacterium]|nr:LysE family translocator [Alphaproteobacteria bacterium]
MDVAQAIAGFTVAAGLATITPGLDTALVLRAAAVEGPRKGMQAAVGIACGCLVWGAAASVGLGAVLAASRVAYEALKVAGALYMLWLGGRMLLAAFRTSEPVDMTALTQRPDRSWLLRGFLTNLLNPKVGVFYVSLLPLFIPAGANVTVFSMLLATIHAAQAIVWFSLLTTLLRPLSGWIQRGGVKRALDGITGGVLVAAGVGLFLDRR